MWVHVIGTQLHGQVRWRKGSLGRLERKVSWAGVQESCVCSASIDIVILPEGPRLTNSHNILSALFAK